MHAGQQPTFLPLTVSATRSRTLAGPPPTQGKADVVQRCAEKADATAVACWAALLGGCQSPERKALPTQLRALSEATSVLVGTRWCAHRPGYRRKVTEAQLRIDDAVRDGDGAEFAEAFVGFDQAIATAVVSAQAEWETATP
jgi:hypothetical protein